MRSTMQHETSSPLVVTVTDNTAMILCGPEDIDPITCPQLVPPGWRHLLWEDGEPEVIDFEIAGEMFEAYLITRSNE